MAALKKTWLKTIQVISLGIFCAAVVAFGCTDRGDAQQASSKVPPTLGAPPAAKIQPTPPIQDAIQLGNAFSQVAEHISKSVVSIRVESKTPRPQSPFGFFFGMPFGDPNQGGGQPQPQEEEFNIVKGGGSGVIISADGAILTNNHVVQKASRIEVWLQDNRRFKGRVVGTDPATDLAVVRIDAKGLPAASIADSNKARVGEWVLAVGSPFGLDYTVTAGVLSAIGRGGLGANEIEDYLQTDASINPGNSGGPLVNLRGEVLGINTMIIGRGTGIGFAIPSNLAQTVAKQLLQNGSVTRAWIGVGFQELTPELAQSLKVKQQGGALVSSVGPNTPAGQAGIQPGDVIVSVQGVQIREGRDLLREVIQKPVGSSLELGIVRNGKETKLKLKTAQRPGDLSKVTGQAPQGKGSEEAAPGFGLELEPLTPSIAQRLGVKVKSGVVVAAVKEGSSADRAGLRFGDVIVEADQQAVQSVQEVALALRDGTALLRLERREGAFFTVLSRDEN